MSDIRFRRALVLPDDEAAEHLTVMADRLRWTVVTTNTDLPIARHVRETVWSPRDAVYLHLITDLLTATHSAAVSVAAASTAHTAQQARRTLDRIGDAIGHVPFCELVRAAQPSCPPRARAIGLVRLALGAPRDADEETLRLLRGACRDTDPAIRSAAVWAGRFVLWPELAPELRRIRKADPEPEIRRAAGDTLAIHRAVGR